MSQATQWLQNAVTDFSNEFHRLAENKMSYFQDAEPIRTITIDGKDKLIDTIGKVAMKEADGRNIKVEHTEVEHLRRKISVKRYATAILVDKAAIRDMAKNPNSRYAEQLMYAVNREKDYVISNAATADVLTGADGLTSLTFANDDGRTIDATAGMTYDIVRKVQRYQSEKATGAKHGEVSCVFVTDQEMEELMGENEFINNDFNEIRTNDGRKVVEALGMKFIELPSTPNGEEPVLSIVGGVRNCLAMAGNSANPAMHFALRKEMEIRIDDVSDIYVEGMQIQAIVEMGAMRQEGIRVIKLQTTPVV